MALFQILFPVFALVACGFAAGRLKLIDQAGFRAIGRFVMLFTLPATIFNAIVSHPFAEIFDPNYLLAYGAGSLVAFAAAYVAFIRKPPSERAILGLGASAANTGFIGYPVALQALGPIAGAAAGLTFLIENLIVIPLALILAEHGARKDAPRALLEALKRVLTMPLIWAVIVGFAVAATGAVIPDIVRKPIELLAHASAPAALFFVGGVLSALELRDVHAEPLILTLGKLLVHPLAVAAFLVLWPASDPALRSAALIFASAPVVTIFPLLGQPFGLERTNSVYLMLSTLIAAVTLPIALTLAR